MQEQQFPLYSHSGEDAAVKFNPNILHMFEVVIVKLWSHLSVIFITFQGGSIFPVVK